jgi:P-loop containing dynein motor region
VYWAYVVLTLTTSVLLQSYTQYARWEAWTAPAYVQPQPFKFHEVMVPTTDSVTHTYLLDNLAPRKPVLFVGDSGTAKTITVERYMAGLKQDAYARLVSKQHYRCYCYNLSQFTTVIVCKLAQNASQEALVIHYDAITEQAYSRTSNNLLKQPCCVNYRYEVCLIV